MYGSSSLLNLFSSEDTYVYRPDFRYTDIENDSKLSPLIEAVFSLQKGTAVLGQNGVCCFSAKHTALRSKSKNWLVQNQNNVSIVE